MNRKQEEKKAKEFNRKGMAYVKAEYKGGGDNQLIVSGDMTAILRIAERIISRVADISGTTFIDTWLTIRELHNMEVEQTILINGVAEPYKGGDDE